MTGACPILQPNRKPVCWTSPRSTKPRNQPWPTRLKPLLPYIEEALHWKPHVPFDNTEFVFESTREAAAQNLPVLESYDFDLQAAISGTKAANTPLRPGSEFCPLWILTKIFYNHPLWDRARGTLKAGFMMPLEPLQDVDRVLDVIDALKYGNHKSTQKTHRLYGKC
jgi:hypothetical protein